jgi:acyl-CoA thioesterase-1
LAGFRAQLAVLALLIVASIAPMASAAQAAPTVLIVGDSLSAGYGIGPGQGWVDLLQRKLAAQGFAHQVVNASISGDTTAGGRSRLGAALQTHKPQIVIIELGGNDGLRGSALASVKSNLDYMVATAQTAGAKVLLLGMRLPPNYGAGYIAEFAALFGDVAKARKAALVPFILQGFGDKPELFQADRIHPTAQAQPLMLDAVWPELRRLLPNR